MWTSTFMLQASYCVHQCSQRRRSMNVDVHNHAIPETVLDLLSRESLYGVTLTSSRWRGGVHVDFDVVPSFVEPAAKLRELETKSLAARHKRGTDGVLVPRRRRGNGWRWPRTCRFSQSSLTAWHG